MFLKDKLKERLKDDPEKLKEELYKINHLNYLKNKEKIIAQHREYRKKKREQLLSLKSV